jgi:hypothetical protein
LHFVCVLLNADAFVKRILSFRRVHKRFEHLAIFMLDRSLALRFKVSRAASCEDSSEEAQSERGLVGSRSVFSLRRDELACNAAPSSEEAQNRHTKTSEGRKESNPSSVALECASRADWGFGKIIDPG